MSWFRYKLWFFLAAFFLLFAILPNLASSSLRSFFRFSSEPFFSQASSIRYLIDDFPKKLSFLFLTDERNDLLRENEKLELENTLLKEKLDHFFSLYQNERYIDYQMSRLEYLKQADEETQLLLARHYSEISKQIDYHFSALPAKVIERDFSSWSNLLWINVGRKDNERLGQEIIAKNSIVVKGLSLIGVVDEVGDKKSRVRLLGDPKIQPSVQVSRGYLQAQKTLEQLAFLVDFLREGPEELLLVHERQALLESLKLWQEHLQSCNESLYLAKGVLAGTGSSFFRKADPLLKGFGFNYSFSDEYGRARDLANGKPYGEIGGEAVDLIRSHDLLISSGMDGIFPRGLQVARVSKVHPLKEGAVSYQLEAYPLASDLAYLSEVFVLPALE